MSTLVEQLEVIPVDVSCSDDAPSVTLSDGRVVSVPLVWFPRLADATAVERSDWELIGGGIGIHWEPVDEDISVESLLRSDKFLRPRVSPVQCGRGSGQDPWATSEREF